MKQMPHAVFFLALSCAGAWSCASGRSSSEADAPQEQTVWGYLEATYDADGDGRISTAEYTRNSDQFESWDRDSDGTLSAADFDDGDRAGEEGENNLAGAMSMGRTRRTLARYFQMDEDAGLLPLAEATQAFALYDGGDGTAADGLLTAGEFTCALEARMRMVPGDESRMVQRAMGDAAPWENLLAGIDGDTDGQLTVAEIAVFYGDVMETDTIDYSDWGGPTAPSAEQEDVDDGLAAQAGQLAPDFTLTSPDGDRTYRLADFQGDRPVALIFGSYT